MPVKKIKDTSDLEAKLLKLQSENEKLKGKVSTEKQDSSPLLMKKITLVMLDNTSNTFHKDPNQATLLTGANYSFGLPLNSKGVLENPLTPKERAYFEKELGINLSVHVKNTNENPEANFWTTRKARINVAKVTPDLASSAIVFDLTDIYDYIKYKICLVSDFVANSWDARHDPNFKFALRDDSIVADKALQFMYKQDEVLQYLIENKGNKKVLFDLIRLYGVKGLSKRITKDTSLDKMYMVLRQLADNKATILSLYNVIKKGKIVLANEIFVLDAITCGAIIVNGLDYMVEGSGVIGSSFEETISFLKERRNSAMRLKIESEIKKYFS